MSTHLQIAMQEANELRFSRKHIDKKIREDLLSTPGIEDLLTLCISHIQDYLDGQYWDTKQARVDQIKHLDLRELVLEILVGTCYYAEPTLFTSVVAQLAGRLKFSDKASGIATMSEIIAAMAAADAYDIIKGDKQASMMLVSNIRLSPNLIKFIEESEYLPPMVCTPLELTNNYSSGYLTHKDSLILGSGNHHDGDICLDVLNTMNQVALKLDTEFLSKVEETPTFELDTADKAQMWASFKQQSYEFYCLMVQQGNRFHLTHKVDKRGRVYSSGYHITTQGTSFKKASLEFADEEIVEM